MRRFTSSDFDYAVYFVRGGLGIGIAVAMLWNYGGNQWWTWETR
jgi:putative flippase GtrA